MRQMATTPPRRWRRLPGRAADDTHSYSRGAETSRARRLGEVRRLRPRAPKVGRVRHLKIGTTRATGSAPDTRTSPARRARRSPDRGLWCAELAARRSSATHPARAPAAEPAPAPSQQCYPFNGAGGRSLHLRPPRAQRRDGVGACVASLPQLLERNPEALVSDPAQRSAGDPRSRDEVARARGRHARGTGLQARSCTSAAPTSGWRASATRAAQGTRLGGKVVATDLSNTTSSTCRRSATASFRRRRRDGVGLGGKPPSRVRADGRVGRDVALEATASQRSLA